MTDDQTPNRRASEACHTRMSLHIIPTADIKVYRNGNQVGQAVYDAMSGGANMSKFIKGDAKISELVDHLFPTRLRKEQS